MTRPLLAVLVVAALAVPSRFASAQPCRETAAIEVIAGLDQPSKPPAGSCGRQLQYRGGFELRSADGRYTLHLSGYLQARYQALLSSGDLDTSGFAIPRARVQALVDLADRVRLRVLLELTEAPPLLDYVLDYRLSTRASLRIGQFKTPFTRSFLTDRELMSFPERSGAVEAVRFDRDIGAGLFGALAGDRVGYYAGVQNGAGRNQLNDNIDMMVVARADVAVLGRRIAYAEGDQRATRQPRLTLGAGVAHDLTAVPARIGDFTLNTDVDGNGERDNIQVVSASADAVFRYRGLELLAEGVWRHERWGTILEGQIDPSNPTLPTLATAVGTAPNRNYLSLYGHATYFAVPRRLLVGARAGYTELPFLGSTGRDSLLPAGDSRLDLDLIAQLYRHNGFRFLALMYTLTDFAGAMAPKPQHRVLLEAFLKW